MVERYALLRILSIYHWPPHPPPDPLPTADSALLSCCGGFWYTSTTPPHQDPNGSTFDGTNLTSLPWFIAWAASKKSDLAALPSSLYIYQTSLSMAVRSLLIKKLY